MRYAKLLIGLLLGLATQFAAGAEACAVFKSATPQTAAGTELRADAREQGGAADGNRNSRPLVLASWIDDADEDSDDPSRGINVAMVGPASDYTPAHFLILPGPIRDADFPVLSRSPLQRYRKLLI